jgi:DNA-binding CsgD family transcriptional regulator
MVHRIGEAQDLDDFGRQSLAALAALVPFDLGTYNELDPLAERVRFDLYPTDSVRPEWDWSTYAIYATQNPLVDYVQRTKDGQARRLSDFIELDDLQALDLYTHVLEPLGAIYQVGITLTTRRPLLVGIALCRRDRDFDDDEVSLLDAMRPHLVQAYRSVQILTEHRAALRSISAALRTEGRAVVTLRGEQPGVGTDPSALELLHAHFASAGEGLLPVAVLGWLRTEREHYAAGSLERVLEPLVDVRGTDRLMVRLIPGQATEPDLLLIDERNTSHDIAALQELGLTAREAEVLHRISLGETTTAIATGLAMRPNTAKKHLEHIYRKLGVSTRSAAAAQAVEAMHWTRS